MNKAFSSQGHTFNQIVIDATILSTAQLIAALLNDHCPNNILIIGQPGSGKTVTANAISAIKRHNPVIIETQTRRQLPKHCLAGADAIIILTVSDADTAAALAEYTNHRVGEEEIMSLPRFTGYFVTPGSDPVKLDIRQLLPA